jgi:acyl-CoA thioesterase-2
VFDLRELPPAPEGPDGTREFSRRLWFRAADPLPDDPAVHASAIAFASDLGVTIAASVTAGLYRRASALTSLDHALWWHRPVRADAWTLLDLGRSPTVISGGRSGAPCTPPTDRSPPPSDRTP